MAGGAGEGGLALPAPFPARAFNAVVHGTG